VAGGLEGPGIFGDGTGGFLATKALGLVSLDTSPFCIAKCPVRNFGSAQI